MRTLGCSPFSNFDLERWDLKQKENDILLALQLSYDQMPSYSRQCFACFSLFPKDYGFSVNCFVYFWGSLGLLRSPTGSQKLENIARQYIHELHSRSFLEDFEDFGHLYYFKLHDLVHDLALYVSKEESLKYKTRKYLYLVIHVSKRDSLSTPISWMGNNIVLTYQDLRNKAWQSESFSTNDKCLTCSGILQVWEFTTR